VTNFPPAATAFHKTYSLRRLGLAPGALNLAWEIAQIPFYVINSRQLAEHVLFCAIASVADIAMTFGIALLALRLLQWCRRLASGIALYLTAVGIATAVGVIVERIGLHFGIGATGRRCRR